MPEVTRNTDALRARRRAAILVKLLGALTELQASGETYAELSVERLLRAAGVHRSTFYAYFEDKTDLLQHLADEALDQVLRAAQHWYSLPARATKADLHAALGRVVDAYVDHRVVLTAISDDSSRSETATKAFESLMDRSTVALAAYIRRGQVERFIDRRLDADATAAWLMWMSEGGLVRLISPAPPAQRARLHAALTDIFWNGLRMGPA
jgi:AcrR family transcriptional regulator